MHICSVNDPEFKSYGNVWNNVPSELTSPVLEALLILRFKYSDKFINRQQYILNKKCAFM